jgi:hypothetical protein
MFRKAPQTRGHTTLWVTCPPLTLSMFLRKKQPYLKCENRGSKEVHKLQYELIKKQKPKKFLLFISLNSLQEASLFLLFP